MTEKRRTIPFTEAEFNAILAMLVEAFPSAFFPRGSACVPLKVGIGADLVALLPDLDVRFLGRYCRADRYLHALASPGAQRRDLFGELTGEVAPEQAAAALGTLEARDAKAKAQWEARKRQEAAQKAARKLQEASEPARKPLAVVSPVKVSAPALPALPPRTGRGGRPVLRLGG
jgi:sRNA-binding protein